MLDKIRLFCICIAYHWLIGRSINLMIVVIASVSEMFEISFLQYISIIHVSKWKCSILYRYITFCFFLSLKLHLKGDTQAGAPPRGKKRTYSQIFTNNNLIQFWLMHILYSLVMDLKHMLRIYDVFGKVYVLVVNHVHARYS